MAKKIFEKGTANKYIILFLSLVLLGVFLFILGRMEYYYTHQVFENAVEFKKKYLRDSVNNLISDIDATRTDTIDMYHYLLFSNKTHIENKVKIYGPDAVQNYFDEHFQQIGWAYFIYDNTTKKIIQDKLNLVPDSWEEDENFIKKLFTAYSTIEYKNSTIVYGVLHSALDSYMEEVVRSKIHRYYYSEDSHIWVNKIINFNGGQNYAIRLIHPNIPSSEGQYLSTDMQDAVGGFPYLDELEGIKNNNGECFYSYYFLKKGSVDVGKKLTYGKLYPDYNWIVCMGIYYDDIEQDISGTSTKLRTIVFKIAMPVVSLFLLLLLLALFLQVRADQKKYALSSQPLKNKVDFDTLTHANSHQFGVEELDFAYRKFTNGISVSPAIMLLDVDHFTVINNTYGKEEGDRVLKEIIKKIYDTIRSSDIIIRWNEDEFIGVFYGLTPNNIESFAKKLLSAVNSLAINCNGNIIHATISLGFTFFKESDTGYEVAVRRADNALYESKCNGRNQFRIR